MVRDEIRCLNSTVAVLALPLPSLTPQLINCVPLTPKYARSF